MKEINFHEFCLKDGNYDTNLLMFIIFFKDFVASKIHFIFHR